MKKFLAIDIGASSGRHIVGYVEEGKIKLEEVFRFTNSQIRKNGHDCWDIEALVKNVKVGIDKAIKTNKLESIGIDTWGVDFVLLDKEMKLVGDAVAYRDQRTTRVDEEVEKIIPFEELYARTGIQKASYNTIYQLMALKKEAPEQLENAAHLLMIPEYLNFALTGNIVHDYTESSTTSLLNAETKMWDFELIEKLGLPKKIFGMLEMPGTTVGDYKGVRVVMPALHDTGSAYLAVPARDDRAVYISSGTWSLLGVENDHAITTPQACEANFTNEGGAWGRYRFLKNIMGLWMIQSIRRELNGVKYVEGSDGSLGAAAVKELKDYEEGKEYSFAELESLAHAANEVGIIIDVNDNRFLSPKSMVAAVMEVAAEAGGKPESVGELMQLVYRSLAHCYSRAIINLAKVTGKAYTSINIVGGGSKDGYLNQLTGEMTGLEVIAGPTEGTALGNLIVQMITAGVFADLQEARAAIR